MKMSERVESLSIFCQLSTILITFSTLKKSERNKGSFQEFYLIIKEILCKIFSLNFNKFEMERKRVFRQNGKVFSKIRKIMKM